MGIALRRSPFLIVLNYSRMSLLVIRTQIASSQPIIIPEGIVTMMQMMSLKMPPFFKNADHLTKISVM